LKAQNVRHAEVMLSGMLFAAPTEGDVVELHRLFRERVDRVSGTGISVVFICAFARGPLPRIERQAGRILALRKAGLIRGVALAGDEKASDVKSLRGIFERFRDSGLGVEIHAGELAGPESVWDAVENGVPDRMGHAVAAFEDEELLDLICERDIHIEMCPTSNVVTGSVPRIEDHPVARARDLKMNFSVNTDDPGPFGCSMNSEFEILAETFGFSLEDFASIFRNTMRSSFAAR
jgi:adenosine deaminase